MDSVNKSTFTNTETSDHIDHKLREDLRLRQPLSQQPLDATDNVNVSNNTTVGAIVGSVGHSLNNAKDTIVENAQNLTENIKERLPTNLSEGASMGAKISQNLGDVKDKIVEAGSNLTENIKEKFSNTTTDNRDMPNVNDSKLRNQEGGITNAEDDATRWIEKIVEEMGTSNNANESHIDHQFREDFRLRQPLVQQPLDASDRQLEANPSPLATVIESAQHTLIDAKDKIVEVAHNLTETVKEKISSTNQEVDSAKVDESSGPTLKDKVVTSLENAKDSISTSITNTSSAMLDIKDKTVDTAVHALNSTSNKLNESMRNVTETMINVKEKTKEQVKEIKDNAVHALQASTDKVNQSLHNLGNTMTDIKDKSIEQATTLKDNVVHSLNNAGSTVDKSMRDVSSTLVDIKEKTIEQTTTLINKLPTETINNSLQSAKEQIVNVVHTIQDKVSQPTGSDTTTTTNNNNNNITALKDKMNDTIEAAKERLSGHEEDKAVEILKERPPQPYENTTPIVENLPRSDLVMNNSPKDNELKDRKDENFHSDLNPNAPEFKPSYVLNSSTSPLINKDIKNLNESNLSDNNNNNSMQYKNKDLLNDFIEPRDEMATRGVQDSDRVSLRDTYKNDAVHGSPTENVSDKFHSIVSTLSNMVSNLWNHNNNDPNRSNHEIDPNLSQPQLLDTTKSGIIAKNLDNRHGLNLKD